MNKSNVRNINNTPMLKIYDKREKEGKLWSKGRDYVKEKKEN